MGFQKIVIQFVVFTALALMIVVPLEVKAQEGQDICCCNPGCQSECRPSILPPGCSVFPGKVQCFGMAAPACTVGVTEFCCAGGPSPVLREQCNQDETIVEKSQCGAIDFGGTLPQAQAPVTPSKPIFFKLNVGIPGSATFNSGKPIELTGATFGEYIAAFYAFFVGMAGILATVMIMYGGVRYVVSRGNPAQISQAKDQITAAITGLVLSLGAYLILLTINPNLVEFNGFKLKTVEQKLQGFEVEMSSEKGAPPANWRGGNVATYDQDIAAYATGEERDWLKAIMLVESSGDPNAQSYDKNHNPLACGLMQLLPSTADLYDNGKADNSVTCADLKSDPRKSIMIGEKYLQSLLAKTCPIGNNVVKYKSGAYANCTSNTGCSNNSYYYATAAYNAGMGANCSSIDCPGQTWWQCVANPGYQETRNYVNKVEQAYNKIVQGHW
jgi:hypothetical protein